MLCLQATRGVLMCQQHTLLTYDSAATEKGVDGSQMLRTRYGAYTIYGGSSKRSQWLTLSFTVLRGTGAATLLATTLARCPFASNSVEPVYVMQVSACSAAIRSCDRNIGTFFSVFLFRWYKLLNKGNKHG